MNKKLDKKREKRKVKKEDKYEPFDLKRIRREIIGNR